MKAVKTAGIIFLITVTAAFIISLFLPDTWSVERSIAVNRERRQVYSYLTKIDNYREWSPWSRRFEPRLENRVTQRPEDEVTEETEYRKQMTWNSESIGRGRLYITETREPDFIHIKAFLKNGEEPLDLYFNLKQKEQGTQIRLTFSDEKGLNPIEKYLALTMIDSIIGSNIGKTLEHLKEELEKP